MWKVARKLYELGRDWSAEALERLRKPGGVLRLTCAVLAAVCVYGAVQLYDHKVQIHELQISSLRCELQMEGARGTVEGWEAAVSQIRDTLVADALERERQLERSRLQLLQAEQARVEAEERAAEFRLRYEDRGSQCRVALELLDDHCADLRGY
mgnify:FL=1